MFMNINGVLKMKKKLIAVLLTALLVCLQNFECTAVTVEGVLKEKEIFEELLKADFADDSVVVTFKEEYSDYNRVFSAADFPDIECESVEDLNDFARKDIAEYRKTAAEKQSKSGAKSAKELNISDEEIIKKLDINVDNYSNVLCINLKEKSKLNVLKTVKKLEQYEEILCAGPNYFYTLDSVYPNDDYYEDNDQWAIDAIQLPEAWEHTKGSDTIKVGVIDTGIDSGHPDLLGKVYNTHYIYFDDPDEGKDVLGHGTHVAGIIGANTNNSKGVAGTCWNVELVSLKIMENVDNKGVYQTKNLVAAIERAINLNLNILNLSGGGYGYDSNVKNAIDSYQGLFVCSAGNGIDTNNDGFADRAANTDVEKHYPSSCNSNNIISVTSFNESGSYVQSEGTGDNTIYYNYGATSVDLAAPGSSIYSTVPTSVRSSGYDSWSGTSMAAPYVTGVAALMMSANPALKDDPVAVKNIILSTVDKHSSLTGKCVSGGKLNAYKAVLGAVNHYTYSELENHGGRFFYTDDTDWFGLSCRDRVFPGDINGDGRTDLIGINYDREICYTANNGRGTYHNQAKLDWNGFAPSWFWNTYNQRLWMADVNADGYDDFIGVSIDGHIYTSINNGNLTFTTPTNKGGTAFRSSSGWFSTSVRERVWPGDINGDGRADLMGISGNGNVYYSLANSSGGYSSEAHINVTNGFAESWFSNNYNQRIWVADVNGDGYDDFIGVSIDGNIYTSINNGNFTFTTPTNKGGIAFRSESAWFSTAHSGRVWPADVNGDGRCDLIGISGDGNVYTCMANSNGTYGSERRNLVVNDNGFNENWFNNTEKQRLWLGIVDRYSRPDFIGVTGNGYAYVSLQLCSSVN